MTAQSVYPCLHNFLFMVPATAGKAEQDIIVNLARKLTSMGYVYMASAHEVTMSDREDIRFMPLHEESPPCFGTLTAVFVVKDASIVEAARAAYPDAHVLLLNPERVAEELEDYDPCEVIASWPASAPAWEEEVSSQAQPTRLLRAA